MQHDDLNSQDENRVIPMAKKNHLRIIIVTLVFTMVVTMGSNSFRGIHEPPTIKEVDLSPKSSQTPHAPIEIDGNAQLETFCVENGSDGLSWETAFQITNLSLGWGDASGIYIRNTERFLILSHLQVVGFQHEIPNWTSDENKWEKGIKIQNCSNVKILNCTMDFNGCGIHINTSTNITVAENYFTDNFFGIFLMSSHNTTISNNYLYDHHRVAIISRESNYNQFISNYLDLESGDGVALYTSNYNQFINCTADRPSAVDVWNAADYGISLFRSSYNQFINCSINRSMGNGIELLISSYNQFINCSVIKNMDDGFDLWGNSNYNLIENCVISNSTIGVNIEISLENTIRRNLIANNSISGILVGYYEYQPYYKNQYISNNTFVDNAEDLRYAEWPLEPDDQPITDFSGLNFLMGLCGFGLVLYLIARINTRKMRK